MICKNCGKEIDNDSIFCEFCGTGTAINKETDKKDDEKRKPIKSKGKAVIIVLLLATLVTIFVFLLLLQPWTNNNSNSQQNATITSKKTEKEISIADNYNEEYYSMYKANKMLMQDDLFFYLLPSISKNGNYYLNIDDRIFEFSESEFKSSCCNNELNESYFDSINAIDFNSNNEYNDLYLQTYKNDLYVLCDSKNIVKINCNNTNKKTTVFTAENGYNILSYFLYDETIFIVESKDNSIFVITKVDKKGNATNIIEGADGFENASDPEIDSVYISNDWLYFILTGNDSFESYTSYLCRCRLDGSEKTVVKESTDEIWLHSYAVYKDSLYLLTTEENSYEQENFLLDIEVLDSKLNNIDSFSISVPNDNGIMWQTCSMYSFFDGTNIYVTKFDWDKTGYYNSQTIKINVKNKVANNKIYSTGFFLITSFDTKYVANDNGENWSYEEID